jgi:hypothetical protein
MKFSFGGDPEFALMNRGQLCSAIGLLPDKKSPIIKDGTRFYYDNVLAEIALCPCNGKEELRQTIQKALQDLSDLITPAKITIKAAMEFPKNQLNNKKAIEAGCVPELSAYTLGRIIPPAEFIEKDEKTDEQRHITPLRTVGGHIHLGHKNEGPLQYGSLLPYIVKMLDLFLAVPEIFFNKDKTSKERRRVYGVAGSHRNPDYGVEYRPLSNFWLSSPTYVNLVYDICDFALEFVNNNDHLKFWQINETLLDGDDPSLAHICYGYDVELLQKTINTCDKRAAKPFMVFISNYLPNLIYRQIETAIEYQPNDLLTEWGIR